MNDIQHASENDTDLFGDFNAVNWAERFVDHVRRQPTIATDPGAMQAWFAGAIMTGYDHGKASANEQSEHSGD